MPQIKPKRNTLRKVRIDEIRALIEQDDIAVEEALLTIYDAQTDAEKSTRTTVEDNGVGFTGSDADYLTKMAEWVLHDRRNPPGQRLSPERRIWTRKRMRKYAKQLERANWFFIRENEPPESSQDGHHDSGAGSGPTESFASRTDALEAAIRRIENGRRFIAGTDLDQDALERAEARVSAMVQWAERIIRFADRLSLKNEKFLAMSRYFRPCADCAGTRLRQNGKCFRCKGKGFQTESDEKRNRRYDERTSQ